MRASQTFDICEVGYQLHLWKKSVISKVVKALHTMCYSYHTGTAINKPIHDFFRAIQNEVPRLGVKIHQNVFERESVTAEKKKHPMINMEKRAAKGDTIAEMQKKIEIQKQVNLQNHVAEKLAESDRKRQQKFNQKQKQERHRNFGNLDKYDSEPSLSEEDVERKDEKNLDVEEVKKD